MINVIELKQNLENYIINQGREVYESGKRGNTAYVRVQVTANRVFEIKCNIAKNELKLSTKRMVHWVGNKYTLEEVFNSDMKIKVYYNESAYMNDVSRAADRYWNTELYKYLG